MALTDIVIPTAEVVVSEQSDTLPTQSFFVRGITFYDIDWLMTNNPADVEALMTIFAAGGESLNLATFQATKPILAAQIIACASDDTGAAAIGVALSLPLPVQADALYHIARLTFEVNGGIKKFIDLITGILLMSQALSGQLDSTGTTDSDNPSAIS